ncbi:hypothetical protein HanRHA438_Chr14g0644861 [Helianthus annuus]|nr:hypothetical protein HanIR_Chr05g0219521 [Helianthus annuus]KAJ0839538.1 hypothetical protein HanPSC8_Chr14g0608051 [Helianthus annuus]KAJ0852888.1 hypothetical protein HanRHA438_Chr14g0644861 [Helianthus annuus]
MMEIILIHLSSIKQSNIFFPSIKTLNKTITQVIKEENTIGSTPTHRCRSTTTVTVTDVSYFYYYRHL